MQKLKIDSILTNHAKKPYIKENDYERLGLRVPLVRFELKKNFSYSSDFIKDQLSEWSGIWNQSRYFESMSSALYFYQHRSLTKLEYLEIKKWINRCSCWEHSDDLSKIYAQVVEDNPSWILPDLKMWNKSKNPWKRRQSVVSLLEYSRKRRMFQSFKVLISFIEPLLADDDYYVQKGVGWTMREIYNIYPEKMLSFFRKRLHDISPVAYSAAVEKLAVDVKLEFKHLRRISRK